MPDYKQSKIFKITSRQTDKEFIGCTTQKYIAGVLATYKYEYGRFVNGNNQWYSAYKIIKYPDVEITLIKEFPCNSKRELIRETQKYIDASSNNCNRKRSYISDKMRINNNRLKSAEAFAKKEYCIYCDKDYGKNKIWIHNESDKHKQNKKILIEITK
jgi:hypothetical protein